MKKELIDTLVSDITQAYDVLANGDSSCFATNKENLEDLLIEAKMLCPNQPEIQSLCVEIKGAIARLENGNAPNAVSDIPPMPSAKQSSSANDPVNVLLLEIQEAFNQLQNCSADAFASERENLEDLLLEANMLYPNHPAVQSLIAEMKNAIGNLKKQDESSSVPPLPSSAPMAPSLPQSEPVDESQENKVLNDLIKEMQKMLTTIELGGIEKLAKNKSVADRLLGKAQALYPDNEQVASIAEEMEDLLVELGMESKAAKLAAEKEAARQAEAELAEKARLAEVEKARKADAERAEEAKRKVQQLEQEAREAETAAKKKKILYGGIAGGVLLVILLFFIFGGSSDDSSSYINEPDETEAWQESIDDVPAIEPAPEEDPVPDLEPVPEEPESELSYGAVSDDMFDYLSNEKLTDADLKGKTKDVLRVMRNAIFARHGYIFQSQDLTDFFERFSWYEPKTRNVNNLLNKVELYNVDMIKKYEK